jgi:hypothetical protein
MGSIAEGQEFFMDRAKPPYRFRDRDAPPLMTDHGWRAEWRLVAFIAI